MMGVVVVVVMVVVMMVWKRRGRRGGRSQGLIGKWRVSSRVGLAQQTLPFWRRRWGRGCGGGGAMEEGGVVVGGAVVVMGRLGGLGVRLRNSFL